MDTQQWKSLIQEWTGMSEDQWEVRQRIISVLAKVDDFRHEQMSLLIDVLRPFALRGFRAMIDESSGIDRQYTEVDVARWELENTLVQQELPREEYLKDDVAPPLHQFDMTIWQGIDQMMRSRYLDEAQLRRWEQIKVAKVCQTKLDNLWENKEKYYRWIEQIQEKEGVSGLCPNEVEIMGEKLIFPFQHQECVETPDDAILHLIPSDLSVLDEWKWILADKFLSIGSDHNCNYYYYDKDERRAECEHDRLKFITPSELLAKVAVNDKASVYQPNDSRSPHFVLTLSTGLRTSWDNTFDVYAIAHGKTPKQICM